MRTTRPWRPGDPMPFVMPPYPPGLPVPQLVPEHHRAPTYARKSTMGEPWFWFVMTLFTCGFALPFWVISIIVKHRKPGPKSKIQYRPYYEE